MGEDRLLTPSLTREVCDIRDEATEVMLSLVFWRGRPGACMAQLGLLCGEGDRDTLLTGANRPNFGRQVKYLQQIKQRVRLVATSSLLVFDILVITRVMLSVSFNRI